MAQNLHCPWGVCNLLLKNHRRSGVSEILVINKHLLLQKENWAPETFNVLLYILLKVATWLRFPGTQSSAFPPIIYFSKSYSIRSFIGQKTQELFWVRFFSSSLKYNHILSCYIHWITITVMCHYIQ